MDESYTTITIHTNNAVCTVALNRPAVHNAMNDTMITELTRVFKEIEHDIAIRAVILRGNGKSFCAGADLNYMKGIAGFGFEENLADAKKLAELFSAIYHCPVPTVAVVHGSAFGGANGLLAACDIVIADEETTFAFSEVKLGIAPATILPFVVRRTGEHGAKELMMTGKRFKGEEALKWQLVNHSVPNNQLETALHEIVKQLLGSAPGAVRQTKAIIGQVINKSPDDVIDYTAGKIAELRASEEGQEGMAAFLEKRKPNWVDQPLKNE